MSGSHVSDVHDSMTDLTIEGGSILDDLNKLRTQVRTITGESSYIDALAGGQSLADIYEAVVVDGFDATINGVLTTTGDAIFKSLVKVEGNATVEGILIASATLHALGVSTFDAKVNITSGGMEVDGDTLELSGADMSIKSAVGASSFTVAAASGDVYARGKLDVDGKATVASFKSSGDAEFSGAVQIDGSDTNAIPYVDVNDKLVMTNSAGLSFDGSDLSVGNKVAIRGNGSAKLANGDFTVSAAGAVYAASDLTVGAKASITAADGSASLANGSFTVSSTGAAYAANDLTVGRMASITAADGSASLADGDFTVSSAGLVSATDAKISSLTSGRVLLSDADHKLVDSASLSFDGKLRVGSYQWLDSADGSVSLADGDFTVSAAGAVYAASDLTVGRMASITAADGSASLANGDFTVSSSGEVVVGSTLEIDGALTAKETAEFQKDVTVDSTAKLKINSLTPTRIAFAGSSKEIVDSANMTYTSAEVNFYGGNATVSSAGKLHLADDLEVVGGKIDLSNSMYVSSETAGELELHAGAVKFHGADLKETGGQVFASIGGSDARNVSFKKDVEVLGNLNVKGATTYIETDNLKVKDAIIHLALSEGDASNARGLVLHGGTASDMAIGAAAGKSDEFVLATSVADSLVDSSNADVFSRAILASAWMAGVKLSAQEGREEGRIEWNATDAAVKLAAINGNKLELQAAGDMMLKANGSEFSLAANGEQALFAQQFDGLSIVGAILSAVSGGHLKKGSIAATDGASSLDFSSVGKLRADYDAEKDMDVYLNGVLLTAGDDYSIGNDADSQGKQIDLVGFSFQAGDKVTFLIRDAA